MNEHVTRTFDNLDRNRDHGFEFDAIGRLKKATGGGASGAPFDVATWTQNYSYDRYGNKTGVTSSGVTDDSVPIPTDGLPSVSIDAATNRMTTASGWSYDNAGNVVRGQNSSGVWQRFEYDAAGRLVKIKDDSNNVIETYTYGADRSRLKTETSTGRTYYAWGGQSVIAEYSEATAATTPEYSKCYIYAGSRLLMTAAKASSSTETQEFQHPDRLGTKLMTNAATGTTLEQSTLPFGTPIPAESSGYSNQIFTTYDRSASTGLDYAVNRTYSSGQGRFTQVDPLGAAASSLGNPQSNNLYAYTQNMPTDFTDPSGLNMIARTSCRYVLRVAYTDGQVDSAWLEQVCETRYESVDDIGTGPGSGGHGGRSGGTTSPQTKLSQADCDKKIAALFGGPAARVATFTEPTTLKHPSAGDNREGHLGGDGTFHIYTDEFGSDVITALYTLPNWTSKTLGVVRFGRDDSGTEGEINYNYFRFNYRDGLTISFVHTGNPKVNRRDRNAAGSIRIGNIAGPGGAGAGYNHTHVNVYKNGKKTDPRKVFCGW